MYTVKRVQFRSSNLICSVKSFVTAVDLSRKLGHSRNFYIQKTGVVYELKPLSVNLTGTIIDSYH